MRRTAIALCLALTAATPALAKDGRTQLIAAVDRELHLYVPDVEARELSTHQLAAIRSIMYGQYSSSEKRVRIRSVIGGRYSLRGLLFN
ncbi:hypothetical protein P1J78_18220 [Psychromarinibacter sp. C21-152]|uniref:Uncharacterized protein n=1 Tax=Psychromarinibacter sediminicola TaxID=3033385 RepID=A0AAE3TB53_9RHOB|nr:hypothetical protein [Psychromarinibacter sediminicola]MDF0602679.1 hypothetical protein [Psychromarinibacter sediminicola]